MRREKAKLGEAREPSEKPAHSVEIEFHLATRPHARTKDPKRFLCWTHSLISGLYTFTVVIVCLLIDNLLAFVCDVIGIRRIINGVDRLSNGNNRLVMASIGYSLN